MPDLVEPFRIEITTTELDDLRQRLESYRPVPSPERNGWTDGASLAYLSELIVYWRERFDWRLHEAKLNQFDHFIARTSGLKLHFVRAAGKGPSPLPLMLVHGWPDGFQRYIKLIPLLVDPGAHGGDPADAFEVIAPSLPGFAYSPRLTTGTDHSHFGEILHTLMCEVLGHRRYAAHGGDVGATVCEQLYRQHPQTLIGVHMTNVPLGHANSPPDDLSSAEQHYLAEINHFRQDEGGYMHLQGTKPWTPAAALNDSPAGLAAWIVEKFQSWSDCAGDIESRFTKDELLTNIMIYWSTQSIGTSFLPYRDMLRPSDTRSGSSCRSPRETLPPAGFADFPKEMARAPKEWAERFYNLQRWTSMPAGGHFAALEEPELLANDIRAFFRPLRLEKTVDHEPH